jgi:hypothetical protein
LTQTSPVETFFCCEGWLGILVLMASTPGPTSPGAAPGPDFPAGPMPSFDHAPSLLAAAWTLLGLASIALGLRVYCKWSSGRRLWWDDGVLIASWVSPVTAAFHPVALG